MTIAGATVGDGELSKVAEEDLEIESLLVCGERFSAEKLHLLPKMACCWTPQDGEGSDESMPCDESNAVVGLVRSQHTGLFKSGTRHGEATSIAIFALFRGRMPVEN